MYDLKIFNCLDDLNHFINKNKIIDYSFTSYEFILKLKTKTINKTNYFLSFKIN